MMELVVLAAPVLAASACILLLLILLYSAVFDALEVYRLKHQKKRKPMRMTILATVGDDERSVNSFYLGLKKWRAKSFDIVLIRQDKNSVPTKTLNHLASKAKFKTRIYSPRKTRKYTENLRQAYARSEKGEVVVIASISSVPSTQALRLISSSSLSTDVYRVQRYSNSNGISGILLGIRMAVLRIVRRFPFKKAEHTIVPFETYIARADTLNRSNAYRIRDNWSIVIEDKKQPDRMVLSTGLRTIGLGIAALLYLYALSVAALDGYGLEVFTVTWVLLIMFGLFLVTLDTFTRPKQKISALLCAGFMPILLAMAIFVKKA